jgi:hypothetical protein
MVLRGISVRDPEQLVRSEVDKDRGKWMGFLAHLPLRDGNDTLTEPSRVRLPA